MALLIGLYIKHHQLTVVPAKHMLSFVEVMMIHVCVFVRVVDSVLEDDGLQHAVHNAHNKRLHFKNLSMKVLNAII